MPIGILVNTLSIVLGGMAGTYWGSRLSPAFKEKLTQVFGICALGIGISSIVLMVNLPAVILSLILGTILGSVLHLGERIARGGRTLAGLFPRPSDVQDNDLLVTAIVLFCASGSGIYGSMISGILGDHSILLAKSALDFFTAMIFACTLGLAVSAIAVPQAVVFLTLFMLAKVMMPYVQPTMVNDFKACGGLILLATGLRIAKVKDFPIADMIPAMVLVWPISWAWTALIAPLL